MTISGGSSAHLNQPHLTPSHLNGSGGSHPNVAISPLTPSTVSPVVMGFSVPRTPQGIPHKSSVDQVCFSFCPLFSSSFKSLFPHNGVWSPLPPFLPPSPPRCTCISGHPSLFSLCCRPPETGFHAFPSLSQCLLGLPLTRFHTPPRCLTNFLATRFAQRYQ